MRYSIGWSGALHAATRTLTLTTGGGGSSGRQSGAGTTGVATGGGGSSGTGSLAPTVAQTTPSNPHRAREANAFMADRTLLTRQTPRVTPARRRQVLSRGPSPVVAGKWPRQSHLRVSPTVNLPATATIARDRGSTPGPAPNSHHTDRPSAGRTEPTAGVAVRLKKRGGHAPWPPRSAP